MWSGLRSRPPHLPQGLAARAADAPDTTGKFRWQARLCPSWPDRFSVLSRARSGRTSRRGGRHQLADRALHSMRADPAAVLGMVGREISRRLASTAKETRPELSETQHCATRPTAGSRAGAGQKPNWMKTETRVVRRVSDVPPGTPSPLPEAGEELPGRKAAALRRSKDAERRGRRRADAATHKNSKLEPGSQCHRLRGQVCCRRRVNRATHPNRPMMPTAWSSMQVCTVTESQGKMVGAKFARRGPRFGLNHAEDDCRDASSVSRPA